MDGGEFVDSVDLGLMCCADFCVSNPTILCEAVVIDQPRTSGVCLPMLQATLLLYLEISGLHHLQINRQ